MGLPALEKAWYNTDHNTLENIFYFRMLSNPCRVPTHEQADLIYVPVLRGPRLAAQHAEGLLQPRQASQAAAAHPAEPRRVAARRWERPLLGAGVPHLGFLLGNEWSAWGSELLFLEGVKDNMWTVVTERAWSQNKIQSSPQPTGFHPQSLGQVQEWQKFVGQQERKHLFAFAGGHRGRQSDEGILREKLFWQCANAQRVLRPRGLLAGGELPGHQQVLPDSISPPPSACTPLGLLHPPLARGRSAGGVHPSGVQGVHAEEPVPLAPGQARGAPGAPLRAHPRRLHPRRGLTPPATAPAMSPLAPNSILVEEVLCWIPSEIEAMRNNIIELIPRLTYGGRVDGDTIKAPDFKDAVDVIVDGLASTISGRQGQ